MICFVASSPARAAEFHPIDSVSASTSATDLWPVSNLIQGPGSGFGASEPHAQLGSGSSHRWVTDAPNGFPSDYIEEIGRPVLTFDLGEERLLSEVSVWGYTSTNANGVSAFRLRFASAADGPAGFGSSIAYSPSFAPTNDDSARQSFAFSETVAARYVEFTCEDNFYSNGGDGPPGGGDRVGLGEVAFADEVPDLRPQIALPASLDFGNPPAYAGAVSRTLAVANTGTGDALTVTTLEVVGEPPAAAMFAVQGASLPLSIAAGESADLTVIFDSGGAEGCFSAQLAVAGDDPRRPVTNVLLAGGVNCVPVVPEKPAFSLEGGTFTGGLSLELTTPTPGAQVLYTTDGSEPAPGNPAAMAYAGPIAIDRTLQVRAAAALGGELSEVETESYVRLAADLAGYTSEIPILVLENFGAGAVPNKGWSTSTQTGGGLRQVPRQPAFLAVFDVDPAAGAAAVAAPPDLDSRAGVRVRGAFSSTWTPKPYSLETWKEGEDADRDVKLLGMPGDSDWILYFPHPSYDRSMLGNTFTWELASRTGRYGTRFRWVDVFVNEDGGDLRLADRRGVYALAEKVKRGGDRIDFDALSDDGATGGWLLGINRMDPEPEGGFPAANGATSPQFFHTPGPNRIPQTPANTAGQGDDIPRQYNAFINFENPNGYTINAAQRAAIEGWFTELEGVFYDDARWLDPDLGYRRYVDTRDFIDYFILLNLGKQGDGLLLSMFPWVSSGERKLHMGPMWDFNNGAYGGATGDPLYFRRDRLWYPRLFDDPAFLREYIDRWFELRRGPLADAAMAGLIDAQAAGIPDALVPAQGVALATWRTRLADMKTWLAARAGWIDSQYFAPPEFGAPGGIVAPGFQMTLANDTGRPGTVFYTTDGSDPMGDGGATVEATMLVAGDAALSALVPSVENSGAALSVADWAGVAAPANAAAWTAGANGAGYDYGDLIGLDLEAAMRGINPGAYLRIPFEVDAGALAGWTGLTLRMKYDDGFVAYLNGVRVAAANAPATPVWDSAATANHPDAQAEVFVEFDVGTALAQLVAGDNMLAVHLLNAGAGSSDALALAELVAERVTVGSPGATAYAGPVAIGQSVAVRARTLGDDGEWSALNEATFITGTLASAANIAVSEIMYHPADGAGEEFIELLNIDPANSVDLTGAAFTNGVDYTFPAGTVLAPGGRVVVVQSQFAASTRLANGGERLTLTAADGSTVRDFAYDDAPPWPAAADGAGHSLVLLRPEADPDHADPANWRPSALPGGNPGDSDAIPYLGGDLLDYALAASPLVVVGAEFASIQFATRTAADAATVTAWVSQDAVTWELAAPAVASPAGDGLTRFVVPLQADLDRLLFRLAVDPND